MRDTKVVREGSLLPGAFDRIRESKQVVGATQSHDQWKPRVGSHTVIWEERCSPVGCLVKGQQSGHAKRGSRTHVETEKNAFVGPGVEGTRYLGNRR